MFNEKIVTEDKVDEKAVETVKVVPYKEIKQIIVDKPIIVERFTEKPVQTIKVQEVQKRVEMPYEKIKILEVEKPVVTNTV